MLIDWFTVGAQVLNFLILVWLMKRFLYKPILDAIDAREQRIAAELTKAEATQTEAQKERDDFEQKNETFDEERAALLKEASDAADTERGRLLDEARAAADALSAKRQDTLRKDAQSLNHALTRRAQDEVFAIARHALTDLASASLEKQMCNVFTGRIRSMDEASKTRLSEALSEEAEAARIRSAFEIEPEQRALIQDTINKTFDREVPLQFETKPDLISGIELSTNGQKVAWSLADYLKSLEKGIGELLKEKPKVKATPKAEGEPEFIADTENK